ncbi:MAG: RPA12/RPB9/RPC11 RNA polymerase family protein, partial [Halobaculum sp.]
MKFCDDCGSMMKTEGEVWVCGSCGAEEARDGASEAGMQVTEGQQESNVVDVSEVDEETTGPTTEVSCPECDNDR